MLKLGIEVSEASVSKYLTRHRKPPSRSWRRFLNIHVAALASIDFLTVPTATFAVLYREGADGVRFQARTTAMGIAEVVIASRSPWRNPYLERLIGSVRREGRDHVIILNDRHLRRILGSHVTYYHSSRTHLSLNKDTLEGQPVAPARTGKVIAFLQVGGLHHRYERLAA